MIEDNISTAQWVRVTLRLPAPLHRELDNAAHASRLPVAVYLRAILAGHTPPIAPPLLAQLPGSVAALLRVLQPLVSNLTQLEAHAASLGEPLSRLSGRDGILFKLASEARALGLKIKTGGLDDGTAARQLDRLVYPATELNDALAIPLNQGLAVELETWRQILQGLQEAMRDLQMML